MFGIVAMGGIPSILAKACVSRGHIDHPEIGIQGRSGPHRAAAAFVGLTFPGTRKAVSWSWNGVELPGLLTGLGIVRSHLTSGATVATGGPDEHQSVKKERRR